MLEVALLLSATEEPVDVSGVIFASPAAASGLQSARKENGLRGWAVTESPEILPVEPDDEVERLKRLYDLDEKSDSGGLGGARFPEAGTLVEREWVLTFDSGITSDSGTSFDRNIRAISVSLKV